jgi:hypothetical protein
MDNGNPTSELILDYMSLIGVLVMLAIAFA